MNMSDSVGERERERERERKGGQNEIIILEKILLELHQHEGFNGLRIANLLLLAFLG